VVDSTIVPDRHALLPHIGEFDCHQIAGGQTLATGKSRSASIRSDDRLELNCSVRPHHTSQKDSGSFQSFVQFRGAFLQ
jgi:hypothetical protein